MTQDQIRAHTPRHIIPEDNMLRRNDAEPVEAATERGFLAILAVVFVMVLAVAVIGSALQAMALAHIGEVLP